jgi:hypothetical protein
VVLAYGVILGDLDTAAACCCRAREKVKSQAGRRAIG